MGILYRKIDTSNRKEKWGAVKMSEMDFSGMSGGGDLFLADDGAFKEYPNASETESGIVAIATQVEFDAETDYNSETGTYNIAKISQIKRNVPPMKYVLLGADVLLDSIDTDYLILTLPIISASWAYYIKFNLYAQFASDTTEMRFVLVRSNTSNLSEAKGIVTQIAQDGALYPTNSIFWNALPSWAGVDLLNYVPMQRVLMSDTRQVISVEAFIQPSNGLNLSLYARKADGIGQCRIKSRSYGIAQGYS